jgi:Tfp pilus assembly PilM family ATPase
MAHLICGIDLGAFSVKFTFVEVGFRTTSLRGMVETAVPAGDAPLLERQAEAVRDGFAQAREATPYFAVPGDQLSVRVLDLPFTDPRKIDQVVGYELEGQIVHALEEVIFDSTVVRQGTEGSTVLAVAAKRDDIAALIAANEAQGTHPRALYAAPVVYRTLLPAGGAAADDEPVEPPCQMIIDLGHMRTNVCILRDGQTLSARTMRRGGAHLTQAIAQAFKADNERAEQAKRGEAYLVSADRPASSPLTARLDAVLREALAPTVRELRQTLASFRASAKLEVDAALITGGTGRLKGLLPFLETELGIPARYLAVRPALERAGRPTDPAEQAAAAATESESHALSGAIALAASRGSREIDFRRGPFVYRASFSVLRQRGWHLAGLAAAILLAGGLDVGAKLSNLGSERKELDKQLKAATSELFGQPRQDAQAVTELLRKGAREELAPLPKATAFDLLDQISRKVPPGDRVKLDVTELDIRPKKTFIKGTADSGAAVDEIATKLKEIDCFEEVTKGAITEVSGGGKQFTLNVTSKCP